MHQKAMSLKGLNYLLNFYSAQIIPFAGWCGD